MHEQEAEKHPCNLVSNSHLSRLPSSGNHGSDSSKLKSIRYTVSGIKYQVSGIRYQVSGNVECRLINSIMGEGLINKITGLGDLGN